MKKTAIILLIALALFACDDKSDNNTNDDNVVKERTATVTGLLDNDSSATVQGNFDKAGLEDAAGKIKTALNTRFLKLPEVSQTTMKNAFAKNVIIILDENPTYSNYSATLNGDTMRINSAILNDTEALETAVGRASLVLGGFTLTPEIG
jgi:uncharacterized protein YcfL